MNADFGSSILPSALLLPPQDKSAAAAAPSCSPVDELDSQCNHRLEFHLERRDAMNRVGATAVPMMCDSQLLKRAMGECGINVSSKKAKRIDAEVLGLNVIDSLLSLHRVPPVCRAASTNEPNDGESSQPKALDDASGLSPREVSAVLGMASAVALSMETALSAGDATMGRPDYNKTQNRHRIQRRNSFVIHRNKGGAGCFLSSMSLDQTTHTRTTRTAPMSRRHSMDSLIMPPPPARTKECIREMP